MTEQTTDQLRTAHPEPPPAETSLMWKTADSPTVATIEADFAHIRLKGPTGQPVSLVMQADRVLIYDPDQAQLAETHQTAINAIMQQDRVTYQDSPLETSISNATRQLSTGQIMLFFVHPNDLTAAACASRIDSVAARANQILTQANQSLLPTPSVPKSP